MKKLCVIFLVFFAQISYSQIINIPDVNFKQKLIALGVDTNMDGEIQQSEAESTSELYFNNSNVASVEGLQYFINLNEIRCENNQITTLDVSMMPILYELHCRNNLLTNLVLSNGITYQILDCSNNQLSVIDLSTLNDAPFRLDISYNQLTEINIPSTWNLSDTMLDISGNLYSSIALPETPIGGLICSGTNLTSLKLMPDNPFDAEPFTISNNPNLQWLDLKNGGVDLCIYQPDPTEDDWCFVNIFNNPALQVICLDENENYSPEVLNQYINQNNPDLSFTTYCTFNPGGDFNTISGVVTYDYNSNGCTITDIPVAGVVMEMSSDIMISGNTFTNSSGSFTSYVSGGIHTVTPQSENPYFSFTPPSFTSSFTSSGETQTANFCLAPNGVHPDLEITILPIIPAQPGFDAKYRIVCKNKGTEVQSGTINLYFEDDVLDFVSALPGISSQVTNGVSWGFLDLPPFTTYNFDVVFNVNSPTETPPVNIDDMLDFTANLDSGADETPNDNTNYYSQTVVGSFDPNDKTVIQDNITWMQFDDYLHYIIRFQNTGTAAATNVVIKDFLSDKLNLSTLEIVSTSHEFRSTLTEGNKFEVFFENINLPAESVDEPGSHGYISYKIMPAAEDITQGDVIENTAQIFFDFNFPIVTNTVTTNIITLGLAEMELSESIKIFPNPAFTTVTISSQNDEIVSLSIYNVLGQVVKTLPGKSALNIPISDFKAGMYIIEVETTNGKVSKQLIKN